MKRDTKLIIILENLLQCTKFTFKILHPNLMNIQQGLSALLNYTYLVKKIKIKMH